MANDFNKSVVEDVALVVKNPLRRLESAPATQLPTHGQKIPGFCRVEHLISEYAR